MWWLAFSLVLVLSVWALFHAHNKPENGRRFFLLASFFLFLSGFFQTTVAKAKGYLESKKAPIRLGDTTHPRFNVADKKKLWEATVTVDQSRYLTSAPKYEIVHMTYEEMLEASNRTRRQSDKERDKLCAVYSCRKPAPYRSVCEACYHRPEAQYGTEYDATKIERNT